ncbi:2115_t:CDS:2 [Diversispora eburnea]|uniref:2115_t:CDS:1 n=1 Tax=Diversispora eburnea TaxID=1213867 RepID=A0A9N9FUX2_9GLOM|nr:2115_t:CDS:2 [Diversispora eburnea]
MSISFMIKKKHFILLLIILLISSKSTASTEYITNSETLTSYITPPEPAFTQSVSIPSETTTTLTFTCNSCKIDSSVRTTFEGEITTETTTEPRSLSESIYTTFSPTITTSSNVGYTSQTAYITTFYRTTTQFYPGYTTTFITTISGRAIQTEYYIPPSTVIILKEVTASVDLAIISYKTKTSNAGDSINLNRFRWNNKFNCMIICLWAFCLRDFLV